MNSVLARAACLLLLATSWPLQAAAQPAPAAERRPLTDFQHMLERPLFSSHRRPEEHLDDDGSSAADEQRVRENWRLTGIVIESGRPQALFVELKGNKPLQLEIGTLLEGRWMLDQIAADRVVLVRDEQRIDMLLYDPSALPPPRRAKPAAQKQPEARPAPAAEPAAAQPTVPTL